MLGVMDCGVEVVGQLGPLLMRKNDVLGLFDSKREPHQISRLANSSKYKIV